MATFKTEKEAQKWNTISKTISIPFSKIAAGSALPTDIKAVSTLLKNYDALAAKLFDECIESASKTADTIVDKLNQERIQLGKTPMGAAAAEKQYKKTLQEVLVASADDTIGVLQDHFSGELDSATTSISEDMKTQLVGIFDKLKGFTGEPAERESTTKPTVAGKVPRPKRTKYKEADEDAEDVDYTEEPNGLAGNLKKLKGFLANTQYEERKRDQAKSTIQKLFGVSSTKDITAKVMKQNETNPELRTRVSVNKQIQLALAKNLELKKQFDALWKADRQAKGIGWVNKVKLFLGKDRQWLDDNWLVNKYRSAKFGLTNNALVGAYKVTTGFVSDKYKNGKRMFGKAKSVADSIGPALMLALAAPQLISSIADEVSKVLNFKTIADFLSNSWKFLTDSGGQAIDWVVKKIKDYFVKGPEGDKTPYASGTLPTYGQAATYNKNVGRTLSPEENAAAETVLQKASPTVMGGNNYLNKLMSFNKNVNQTNVAPNVSFPSLMGNAPTTATTPSIMFPKGGANVGGADKTVPSISGSTTIESANPVIDTPGITIDAESLGEPLASTNTRSAGGNTAGNSVSLSSINMRPGGDSLFVYNAGLLSA